MDSTITLVNPSTPVTLVFTKNSTTNTGIALKGPESRILYSVSSDALTCSKTTIADSTGTVAIINKRDILPSTVSFPSRDGQGSMKLSKWLREQKTSDGHPIMMIETTLGQFGWKYDTTRIALWPSGDEGDGPPTACLRPATSEFPMSLIIDPSGLALASERAWMRDAKTRAFVEDVLVSALVIEHRLRVKDRMYHAAADIPRGSFFNPMATAT
ncbi:hypothetical protein CCMSSC00406_0007562 [Pleurotus cornucopiae]|uniref:Uncharacterized protein n=1 Tax=Pleurotus cornucopiae TaxID=5321 RepID=A0ACB7J6R9_PLECO|nr:hypothetical protein CCMSSC00406_0007562 [Pleurotus cornucopiae]